MAPTVVAPALLGALCLLFPVDAVPVVLVGIGDRLLAFAPAVARRRGALRLRGPFARRARCLGGGLACRRAVVACRRFSWSASWSLWTGSKTACARLRPCVALLGRFTWRRSFWRMGSERLCLAPVCRTTHRPSG